MRFLYILFISLFIFGCSAKYTNIKTTKFTEKKFALKCDDEKYLLYVSKDKQIYKFVMFDGFGAPVISKNFNVNHFENTKFIYPNSKFDKLFIKILKEENIKKYQNKTLNCKVESFV